LKLPREENNMRILKMGFFLAIVAALAGGSLAFVNSITADIIAENAIASEKANLELIFPDTDSFVIVENFEDESGLVLGVYEAVGSGLVYKVQVTGYSNPIIFMVGISDDAKIVGYEVLEVKDTAGIGDRIAKDEFSDGVIGKTSTEGIPVLSGATVSSGAVVTGINAVKDMFNKEKGIEDDGTGSVITPPPISFSSSVGIFTAKTEKVTGEVIEETEDGDEITYIVDAKGYAILEAGYDDALPNQFKVVLNKSDNTIVSVSFVKHNDTEGIGNKIDADEFFGQFKGLDTTNKDIAVDAVSGATVTSESAARAVRAAIGGE
jgi:Na+-translocating ferredoxin:NAD+ oxidoreductase RnfG subunit